MGACSWCDSGGRASATVRVDNVGDGVYTGILNDRYADWNNTRPWAWCYSSSGTVMHKTRVLRRGLPRLVSGSVVRVTLAAHRVIFNVNGQDQYTVTLPEECGDVMLGMALTRGAKVTLLP